MQSLFSTLVILLLTATARAEVKPAPLFTDHMVLQRDVPLPVWGTAAPGEKVAVSLLDQTVETVAGADGRWMVRLGTMKAGGSFELVIAGVNRVVVKDVLVGEVWVAGGQSNMEMKLIQSAGGIEAAGAADDPLLRVFRVGGALPNAPTKEFRGAWQVCTPGAAKDWSAAGYYFAADLRRRLNVPVALVQNAMGWTVAEAWTSRETLVADAELKPMVDRWDLWTAAYPGAKQLYEKKLADWQVESEKLKAQGKPALAKPAAPSNPEFLHRASSLYNGMVYPLMPYAIRGVIWYQGETNASRADQYRRLFPAMIGDWRSGWGQGDFPFIFVQIAPLDAGPVDRAELRDAQREALAVKNTAMVVTVDIGEAKDEHPRNKKEVGRRLALAAEKLAYGRDVVASGPLYKGMSVQGNAVTITFSEIGGGLVAADPAALKGFAMAGEDRKFVPAEARIQGQTVVVTASGIASPKAVRYAFANLPEFSLFNKEGLPASPFRTDDWPLTTKGETRMFFDQIGLDEKTLTPAR